MLPAFCLSANAAVYCVSQRRRQALQAMQQGSWAGPPHLPILRCIENAQVGAGSVVTMDLPPACVAVGVPARIIKINHKPPVDDMDQCDDYIHDYVI